MDSEKVISMYFINNSCLLSTEEDYVNDFFYRRKVMFNSILVMDIFKSVNNIVEGEKIDYLQEGLERYL